MLLLQIISGVVQSFSETLEMHDFPFSQEAQWREHIGVIRQVDEIFIGAARFLLCCVGVSAKKKAGESKDSQMCIRDRPKSILLLINQPSLLFLLQASVSQQMEIIRKPKQESAC